MARTVLATLLAACAAGCASPPPSPAPEVPLYEGKSLAFWLGEMRDLSFEVQTKARTAVQSFGTEAAPPLAEMLGHPRVQVRRGAAIVLQRLRQDAAPAAGALMEATRDPDIQVCLSALGAVANLLAAGVEVPGGLDAVLAGARDERPVVRREACSWMAALLQAGIALPGGGAELAGLMGDAEAPVRDQALFQLRRLVGAGVAVSGGVEALESRLEANPGDEETRKALRRNPRER